MRPVGPAPATATRLPVVVGFGIDGPRKARIATGAAEGSTGADGVVVGTAIVRAIESTLADPSAPRSADIGGRAGTADVGRALAAVAGGG